MMAIRLSILRCTSNHIYILVTISISFFSHTWFCYLTKISTWAICVPQTDVICLSAELYEDIANA